MNIIENTLEESIDDVLQLPLYCFVATLSKEGDPRVSPLWYHWEEQRMWIIADLQKTYTSRIQANPATAIAVVDFDPYEARVRHIGMRGISTLEPLDDNLMQRKLTRYLGPNEDEWDPMFHDLDKDRWRFIKFEPKTIVARNQSYKPSLSAE